MLLISNFSIADCVLAGLPPQWTHRYVLIHYMQTMLRCIMYASDTDKRMETQHTARIWLYTPYSHYHRHAHHHQEEIEFTYTYACIIFACFNSQLKSFFFLQNLLIADVWLDHWTPTLRMHVSIVILSCILMNALHTFYRNGSNNNNRWKKNIWRDPPSSTNSSIVIIRMKITISLHCCHRGSSGYIVFKCVYVCACVHLYRHNHAISIVHAWMFNFSVTALLYSIYFFFASLLKTYYTVIVVVLVRCPPPPSLRLPHLELRVHIR